MSFSIKPVFLFFGGFAWRQIEMQHEEMIGGRGSEKCLQEEAYKPL